MPRASTTSAPSGHRQLVATAHGDDAVALDQHDGARQRRPFVAVESVARRRWRGRPTRAGDLARRRRSVRRAGRRRGRGEHGREGETEARAETGHDHDGAPCLASACLRRYHRAGRGGSRQPHGARSTNGCIRSPRRLNMSAQSRAAGLSSKSVRQIVLGIAVALGLVVAAGGVVWTVNCPCETTPGFVLLGDAHEEPVTDWSFANDVPLCQVQVSFLLRPHSLNVNCMATPEGDLFISCSVGTEKYWCPRVTEDHPGRLPPRRRRLPRRPQPRDGPGPCSTTSGQPGCGSCRSRPFRPGSRAAAANRRHSTRRGRRAGGRSASSRAGSRGAHSPFGRGGLHRRTATPSAKWRFAGTVLDQLDGLR